MRAWRVLWLLCGAMSFFVVTVLWLDRVKSRDRVTFARGSVFNSSEEGLSLAFDYLKTTAQPHEGVGVLDRALDLSFMEPDAVVFRIRPQNRKSLNLRLQGGTPDGSHDDRILTEKEERWIRAGGRLVLAVAEDLGPIKTRTATSRERLRKCHPSCAGVQQISDGTSRFISEGLPAAAHAPFIRGSRPIVARWLLDRGEVIVLSVPEIMENAHLGKVDHLRLLVALASRERARMVYFDEHAHGLTRREGLLGLMAQWGFGPAMLCGAIVFLIALWRANVRIGPAEDDPRPLRSDAVDLLDSMAQLYDRTLSRRDAADRFSNALRRAVAVRTGFKGRALEARLVELIGGDPPRLPRQGEIREVEFQRIRQTINKGFGRLFQNDHAERRR